MIGKINRYSPLTEATFYILLSLTERLHGYGIIKKTEEMSKGRIKLAAGTLYGAINSLVANKLIISEGEDSKNKRRKLYEITKLGVEVLEYEIFRLEEMLENGRNQLERRG